MEQPNVASYPNITFNSVSRNDSGNYSITVSNEAGSVSTFFILDVQCKLIIIVIVLLLLLNYYYYYYYYYYFR